MYMSRRRNKLDELDGIESVDHLANVGHYVVWIISTILVLLFAWVQLNGAPFIEAAKNASPEFLVTTALVIYYACWFFGATFDINAQKNAYVIDPNENRFLKETIGVGLLFLLATLALVAASTDIHYFAVALAIFVLANFFGGRFIRFRVRGAIETSRRKLLAVKNHFRAEELRLVEDYMFGVWQDRRFFLMLAFVCAIIAVSFNDQIRVGFANLLFYLGAPIPATKIIALLPSSLILFYVLVAESWIWFKRLELAFTIRAMKRLRKKFVLRPVR
jgi:hypothetical protein